MRKVIILFTYLFGTIGMMVAYGAERDVVIFRASIVSLTEIERGDTPQKDADHISWRTPTEATVSVIEVLLGKMDKKDTSIMMYMGAQPLDKMLKDIYFVAIKKGDGGLEAVWWDFSRNGICIPDNIANDLNIVVKLRELRNAGKLKCLE